MSTPKNEYQIAIVLTISAASYAQALEQALEMEVCRKVPSKLACIPSLTMSATTKASAWSICPAWKTSARPCPLRQSNEPRTKVL